MHPKVVDLAFNCVMQHARSTVVTYVQYGGIHGMAAMSRNSSRYRLELFISHSCLPLAHKGHAFKKLAVQMALLGTAAASALKKTLWLAALQKQGPPHCGKAADKLQGVAWHFGSPLRIVELGAAAHPAGMSSHG